MYTNWVKSSYLVYGVHGYCNDIYIYNTHTHIYIYISYLILYNVYRTTFNYDDYDVYMVYVCHI